jgi:Protein of unknown function (DUF3684)
VRTKAFSFFLANISNTYSNYNPKDFHDVAFVPAVLASENVLAKPLEVRDLTVSCFPSSNPTLGSCTLTLNGQH